MFTCKLFGSFRWKGDAFYEHFTVPHTIWTVFHHHHVKKKISENMSFVRKISQLMHNMFFQQQQKKIQLLSVIFNLIHFFPPEMNTVLVLMWYLKNIFIYCLNICYIPIVYFYLNTWSRLWFLQLSCMDVRVGL